MQVLETTYVTLDEMRFSSIHLVGLAIVGWTTQFPEPASAGLHYPSTEIAVSEDQQLILVNICPEPLENELTRVSLDEWEKYAICDIRATYPKSGLYRNDGSTEALWTYEGYWGANPIIAPDGEHVIFEGDWTRDEHGIRAVAFMRNGKVLRSYVITEIIPQYVLKRVLNGFAFLACAETTFNPEEWTYCIRTNQGEEIVFDVKSGELIDVRSPFPVLFAVAFVGLTTLFALVIVCWRRRRQMTILRAAPAATGG